MEYERIPWDNIDSAVNAIIEQIRTSKIEYDIIYGVPRGGLPAAVMLSHRLNVPLVHSMEEVLLARRWEKQVLIVDDISDSGRTLKHFSVDQYHIATLYVREHTTVTQPDYKGFSIHHDKWLVFPWETVQEAEEKKSLNTE